MSKQRSLEYRMRRAVTEASQEHDGAYRCPLSMRMIAERHGVDLSDLTRRTTAAVEERHSDEAAERERFLEMAGPIYDALAGDDSRLVNDDTRTAILDEVRCGFCEGFHDRAALRRMLEAEIAERTAA